MTFTQRFSARILSRVFGVLFAMIPLAVFAATGQWSVVGQPSGGTVLKVVQNPAAPGTLYALGTSAVFKSTDSAAHWTTVMQLPLGNAGDVALDPLQPSTVYVATQGYGMWKSTDGGSTWAPINNGLPKLRDGGTNVDSLYRVTVDPNNEGVVYVITLNHGVYKSSDSGAVWSAANTGLDVSGEFPTELTIDPANSQHLYLTSGSGIYESTDAGAHWSQSIAGVGFDSVVVDPSNNQNVYAGGSGLYISDDGGKTWRVDRGMANDILAVDPADPTHLWGSNIFIGLLESTDQGRTWNSVATGRATYLDDLIVDAASGSTLYLATVNFGLMKSTDGGATWAESDEGLYGVVTEEIFIGPDGNFYIGSLGTGVLKSTDNGASWSQINNGITSDYGATGISVYALVQDPVTPATLYAGTVLGLYKTTDGGDNWTLLDNGISDPYTMAVAVDPQNTQNVYIGTQTGGVFKSSDGGSSWSAANTGITDSYVIALAVDPADSNTVFAGTYSDGLFKSSDGGQTWQPVNVGNLVVGVWAIAIDPTNPQVMYASLTNQNIYKSTDGGATWNYSSNGIPPGHLFQSLQIDPADHQTLYATLLAGTGVYISTDAGANWTELGSGDPAMNASSSGDGSAHVLNRMTEDASPPASVSILAVAVDPKTGVVYGAGKDGQVYRFRQGDSGSSDNSGSSGGSSGSGSGPSPGPGGSSSSSSADTGGGGTSGLLMLAALLCLVALRRLHSPIW